MDQAYRQRDASDRILRLFKNFPVVVISGARQVGKSTLLEALFPKLERVVFDPIVDVEGAKADPDLFLANRPAPIILDEIQYVPELVSAIKRKIEKNKKNSQYLITGSQQWEVMKHLSESLAGRAVFVDLHGFNFSEISEAKNKRSWLKKWLESSQELTPKDFQTHNFKYSLYEHMWRGFLPKAFFLPKDVIPDFHLAYERTYIERDVRLMAEISDLALFSRFFRLCASLTAQEINYSELGREIGLTPQTASRWLSILKATFQWSEIQPYAGNTIKRLSNKSKGYITDTGLACFAMTIASPEGLGGHPKWGSLFETFAVNEILKQCNLLSPKPNVYHWRSHAGAEVDLILEINNKFYPIEIKGTSHPSKKDARGIKAFQVTYPNLDIQKSMVFAPCEKFHHLTETVVAIPWDASTSGG
jgi:uncharacterized protein